MRRVPSVSFEDYLRLYETSWTRLHAGILNLGSYKDRTLCSTWQISYEQVRDQDPLAAQLLQWWAFFDNKDVWFELLQPVGEDSSTPLHDLADELNFNNAMGTLQDYGFVEPHTFSDSLIGSRGYNIHSCLHSWIINVLNERSNTSLQDAALRCVVYRDDLRRNRSQHWLLHRRRLPHALACSTWIHEGSIESHWAFNDLGLLFAEHCKFNESEKMYLRAIAGLEKALGPDYISTLETVNNLGLLYLSQLKLNEAEEMFLRALNGFKKAQLPDHFLTLQTVNNLGLLYAYRKKPKEAEKMYLHALAGYEQAQLPDDTLILDTVFNLACLYGSQGKLEKAKKMFLRALTGREKTLGPDHLSTLQVVSDLSLLYTNQRKFEEAENMYLRLLEGWKKFFEPNHMPALLVAYNLGVCYSNQGKLDKAKEMYLHTLAGCKKAIPAESLDTDRLVIYTKRYLGELSKHEGRLQDAHDYLKSAYRGLQQTLGESNQEVQSVYQILVELNDTIPTTSSPSNTIVASQASEIRRRDTLKKVLGIRLGMHSYGRGKSRSVSDRK